MSNERVSERSEGTVERVSFGGLRLKMQLSKPDMQGFKDRKMVTRWFNDDPGRIERALAGGYNYVDPRNATSLGQGALHRDSTDLSRSRVSIVVTRGEPVTRAYLMEIKQEFFDVDQAAKEAINFQVDEALALGGSRGSDLENEYRPT